MESENIAIGATRSIPPPEVFSRTLVPPHNDDAEAATLGSMLLSREAADKLLMMLKPEDFYNPVHREIFSAMQAVAQSLRSVDLITVKEELQSRRRLEKVGGQEYLEQLIDAVPTPAHAEHYAEVVKDYSTERALQESAFRILRLIGDSDLGTKEKVDLAERLVFSVAQSRLGKDFVKLEQLAHEYFAVVDHVLETGEPMRGLSTGFPSLDRLLEGFHPGNLIILAARPSVGKTSLALMFGLNAALRFQRTVALFSLEMSAVEIVMRLVSMVGHVDASALKRGKLTNQEYEKMAEACDRLYQLKFFVDDTSDLSPFEMLAKCRRLKASEGQLDLVIVDYLQLMRAPSRGENRTQQIAEISRALKIFAKELNVPIVALSQLSRLVEHRSSQEPKLADLRDSGAIEADADVVLLLHKDAGIEESTRQAAVVTPHEIEVRVAKNRNGPRGNVRLMFTPSYTLFTEVARYDE
jgi:replicative DNA helicase